MGRLRERKWERFLWAPDPALVRGLYEPALSVASRYDRCCAYFSSSVLAAAARGFGPFLEHLLELGDAAPRPAIRLLVNEELQEQDVRALQERHDTSGIAKLLEERLVPARTALEQHRLDVLTYLYAQGFLDIRVGVMRQSLGVMHSKFGLVYDDAGDAVVFRGSGNETVSGLRGNFEQLEITGSWDDPVGFEHYRDQFERLWKNEHPDVKAVDLPEAVRDHLVRLAPSEPPAPEERLHREILEAAMKWQFIAAAPYLVGPSGEAACDATAFVDPWPHQRRVVDEAVAAWPDGRLLCDEVGMGKTIEAILILRRLLHGRGVRRVLFLLPAGLMQQWQDELREKGGLIVPRYESGKLVWYDGRAETIAGLGAALEHDLVIVSRELARLEQHKSALLNAEPWDLVLVDESHAARRAKQEETEFNSATLLLGLLRDLQLQRQARSLLLLSATPMQTHPWEPFDLLQVLGEGGEWLADFANVRTYYNAAASLGRGVECSEQTVNRTARLIALDGRYAPPPANPALDPANESDVEQVLAWSLSPDRPRLANWLRDEAPLARRMHRNTRDTLRRYYERGLLQSPPPVRIVEDVRFDYENEDERELYLAVGRYIDRRFEELEQEKAGKGFVMTIYRRRASSSPQALRRSLERRREGLLRVLAEDPTEQELGREDISSYDFDDAGEGFTDAQGAPIRVSRGLPEDPAVAAHELNEVDGLLNRLQALAGIDSKRDRFFEVYQQLTSDGRPLLVFTEAADTMEYLRDQLLPAYGSSLATYSGEGGWRYTADGWVHVSKQAVTDLLNTGELRAVVCTDAASEGLNLQAAAALINYDLPWNPSRVEQRIGRIDRIGQKYPDVRIANLFLEDSIDDRVYQVLRERCGLFTHFVGQMQPVLAEARRILLGRGGSLDTLVATAENVETDELAADVYREDEGIAENVAAPALRRDELLQEVEHARAVGATTVDHLDGTIELMLGTDRLWLAAREPLLADNPRLEPLTPAHPLVAKLERSLRVEAPLLPLVIESRSEGSFRVAAASWVGTNGEPETVETFEQLRALLASWDGSTPERVHLEAAHEALSATVQQELSMRVARAEMKEAVALTQQVRAASGRLLRELCRYLIVRHAAAGDPAPDELNLWFYEDMSRPGPAAARLSLAFDRLGGYPTWDPVLIEIANETVANLNENGRNAVLSMSALDAALADPRWKAAAKARF